MAVLTPEAVLRNYFHAKDENRPHVLERVFGDHAVLTIESQSAAIAFPGRTVGRDAIADVLVRSFAQTFENVYSFYLQKPGDAVLFFECDWIVGMTDKATRSVRFGCGRYRWDFDDAPPRLARTLAIRIADMRVLPPSRTQDVLARLHRLSYPWTSRAEADAVLQPDPDLEAVLSSLARA